MLWKKRLVTDVSSQTPPGKKACLGFFGKLLHPIKALAELQEKNAVIPTSSLAEEKKSSGYELEIGPDGQPKMSSICRKNMIETKGTDNEKIWENAMKIAVKYEKIEKGIEDTMKSIEEDHFLIEAKRLMDPYYAVSTSEGAAMAEKSEKLKILVAEGTEVLALLKEESRKTVPWLRQ